MDQFTRRLVEDLVENNVLRGAWVEEIVAFFLTGWTFPGAWSYFDLLHPGGEYTLSVKHATGSKPRFTVARKKWAWDNRLAAQAGYEGWRGDEARPSQHWCNVYVFAWLDGALERERVLSVDTWRFAVLSRDAMYHQFDEGCNSVAARRLRELSGGESRGTDLPGMVNAALTEPHDPRIPPIDLRPQEEARPAAAVIESVQQVLELPD